MIGDYLVANYDAVDLNGDGTISYTMMKGDEVNIEAIYRTQYGVEDANAVLTAAGKPALLTKERRATGIFGVLNIRENTVISSLKRHKRFGLWLSKSPRVRTPSITLMRCGPRLPLRRPRSAAFPAVTSRRLSLAVGAVIGLVNGFFVAKFSLHPFIVTLSTQLITYGIILWFFALNGNNGQPISGLSDEYKLFVNGEMFRLGNVAVPRYVAYAIILVAPMWFIWNKTTFGKNMFAVGSNAEAAKVSGVNVFWTTVLVHTLAGAMYGYTGFIEGARSGSVAAATGSSFSGRLYIYRLV